MLWHQVWTQPHMTADFTVLAQDRKVNTCKYSIKEVFCKSVEGYKKQKYREESMVRLACLFAKWQWQLSACSYFKTGFDCRNLKRTKEQQRMDYTNDKVKIVCSPLTCTWSSSIHEVKAWYLASTSIPPPPPSKRNQTTIKMNTMLNYFVPLQQKCSVQHWN